MLEHNKVYHGDCFELMPRIPDKSVNLILCDLPYGMTDCKWDSILPMDKLWKEYKRILAPNGAIVLTACQPFASALIMSNPRMFKHEWIWQKTTVGNFMNAKRAPLRIHESVLVFGKDTPSYYPQGIEVCGKQTRQGVSISDIYAGKVRSRAYISSHTGYPRSILKFKSQGATVHPTQKPVPLFEYLIKMYSKESDVVLDNCAGSGTTAIAALRTKRNFILMEMEEKYYNICIDRIDKEINKPVERPKKGRITIGYEQTNIMNLIENMTKRGVPALDRGQNLALGSSF